MSPLYEVPTLRGVYPPQHGDFTLWLNRDHSVLDLSAIIWLGFVSCTPAWSGWNQGMLCSRSLPQVEHPCGIFLCLVHRAAGKFIPAEAGWGAGGTGIFLLTTELTSSYHWVDDDGVPGNFWESGETIPVWQQHLRGNHQSCLLQ